jgi:hypothetical protein
VNAPDAQVVEIAHVDDVRYLVDTLIALRDVPRGLSVDQLRAFVDSFGDRPGFRPGKTFRSVLTSPIGGNRATRRRRNPNRGKGVTR